MSVSNNQQTKGSHSRDQGLLQETIGSEDTGQREDGECIACVIENRAKEVINSWHKLLGLALAASLHI